MALIVETAGPLLAATGVGFTMTFTEFGMVVGPPTFGLIVDLAGSFQPGWLFLGLLSAIGMLTAVGGAKGERRGA